MNIMKLKILKKKKDPRRLSITVHQRLSSPFERTVLKKYSSSTSNQQPRSYTSTSTIKKTNYGGANDSLNKYNSFTSKQDKNKTVAPSKLYETYKPSKNTSSYTQTKTTTTIKSQSKAPVKTTVNQYQIKTITSSGKSQTNNSKYEDRKENALKYVPKNASKNKYNRPETEPNFVGEEQTKTETTQDGDYLIKVTTTKKQVSGMNSYGGRRHGGYPGQKPRMGNNPRGGKKPSFGEEPGEEEEKEKPNSNNRPSYGGPRHGFGGSHGPHGFGGPHGPHGFGGTHEPHGFGEPRGTHGFGGPHGPHMDLEDLMDHMDLEDLMDLKELMDHMDLKDLIDHMDLEDLMDHLEVLDLKIEIIDLAQVKDLNLLKDQDHLLEQSQEKGQGQL